MIPPTNRALLNLQSCTHARISFQIINYEIFFFVRSKKFLFPVLSGGKDITPAKFQLNRFITVGGVDGQTHIPGPYVNYSRMTIG